MCRFVALALCLSIAAARSAGREEPEEPKARFDALAKEFAEVAREFYLGETSGDVRDAAVSRVAELTLELLDLAENHPTDPIALDTLVQVVLQDLWLQNNTLHPGFGEESPEAKAIAILLRDHVQSDQLGEACRRLSYGFRKECETYLRTVWEKNPHREVQALACLRLAQFMNRRLDRLDLIANQPDVTRRYERLFGKDYLDELRSRPRTESIKEVEAVFERALEEFGEVKVPYSGTVAEVAEAELFGIRRLAVGKGAPPIEGQDQDGEPFKLSDHRGKVILVYFWSQY